MGSPFKYTLFQELEVKIFQLVATFSFVKRLAHSACPSTSAQNVVFAFKNSLQKNIQGCTVRAVSLQRVARWLNKDAQILTVVLLSGP